MKNYMFEIVYRKGFSDFYIVRADNLDEAYFIAEDKFVAEEIIFIEEVDDVELESELWDGHIVSEYFI